MNRSWRFEDNNMLELNNKMSTSDKEIFNVSMEEYSRTIDDYMKNIVRGSRKYFFKETEEDIRKARRKLFLFQIFHYILLFMIYTALFYFGFRFFSQFSFSNTVGNCVKYMKDHSST